MKDIVTGNKHASGRNPLSSTDVNADLANTIKGLTRRGFPLKAKMARDVAYPYACQANVAGFSKKIKCTAGRDWFHGFMDRQTSLTIRKPEALSAARASGNNKPVGNK